MEIYLSCSEIDMQTAVHLKEDLEAHTSLAVAMENEDWEDVEDFEFEDQIHQAEILLILETETSNITAWLIDENKPASRTKSPPTEISCAPTINISDSYEACCETLLGLVAKNMHRRYLLQMSDDEDDEIDVNFESRGCLSRQGSKRSLSSISNGASDEALVPVQEDRKHRKTKPDAKMEKELRDLFANARLASNRTLDRADALKARRQNRRNRKNCLQEARAANAFAVGCI